MRARAIDQHAPPLLQPTVDLHRDAVVQTIGPPAQGKVALGTHVCKTLGRNTYGILTLGLSRTGDHPPSDCHVVSGQCFAGSIDQ
ncbi:hypothetical protein D3C80_1819370 [compost metagenome]